VFPTGSAVVVIATCAQAITGHKTDSEKAIRWMNLPVLDFQLD
jgi:hypothetical protein